MQLNLLYNVIANNKELAMSLNKCNIKFSILFRIPSQVDHFPSAVIINNGTIFDSDQQLLITNYCDFEKKI